MNLQLALSVLIVKMIFLSIMIPCTLRLVRKNRASLTALFFAFGQISFLLSDLYWLAYANIRPDTRMPFAVNEVGEWAIFLLFSESIVTVFGRNTKKYIRELIFTTIFMAFSVAFWIGWSGEWIQDIFTGICFGYLAFNSIRAIREAEAFRKAEWNLLRGICFFLVLFQTLTFVSEEKVRSGLDVACYVLMISGSLLLLIRYLYAAIRKADSKKLIALSFGGYAFCTSCMYMSADPFYDIELIMCSIFILFAYLSIRKAVMSDDLC